LKKVPGWAYRVALA